MELHCGKKKHGLLIPDKGLIEVSCASQFCGKAPGVVVLHRFDVRTGLLVETLRFQEPPIPRGEETPDANHDNGAAVRNPGHPASGAPGSLDHARLAG